MEEPAAFGRLRVETSALFFPSNKYLPAAFGRLRVETPKGALGLMQLMPSRLRAAAC